MNNDNLKTIVITLRELEDIERTAHSFAVWREKDGGVTIKGFGPGVDKPPVYIGYFPAGSWLSIEQEDEGYFDDTDNEEEID